MCNCNSYNRPKIGHEQSRIVYRPCDGKKICIDDCIADTILFLWKHEIETFGSCCGHNEFCPSVIVENNCTKEKIKEIKHLIAQVDDRLWNIQSWCLISF